MPLWLGWTLALLVAAGFARLGFWQLARMHEKEAMLARVAEVFRRHVVHALDSDVVSDYEWVGGEAEIQSATLLLDNQMREGRAGVHLYCIAKPVPTGPNRLVDFGWMPMAEDRSIPNATCPVDRIFLRGLSTPIPSSGLAIGQPLQETGNRTWLMTRVDPEAIRKATGMSVIPRVLRLDPSMKNIGYARDLDVLPNTLPPSRHLGYAVQWFALAAAVLATAGVLTFRKPRA